MNRIEEIPKRIWIVGGGFMGQGIAQLCAQCSLSVSLIDVDEKALADARKCILWSLQKLFQKKQISEEPETVLRRIVFSKNRPTHNEVDFLIECVPEDLYIKKSVLKEYDQICPPETIFASNTSAIPIGKIAASTRRQDRFIGTHFACPPVIQKLVEMIPCPITSAETIQYTRFFLKALEREVIEVKVDIAGFIMNRIYLAAAAEGIRLLERGISTAAEIDLAMREGYGWSKGPLEAADLAGLDIIRAAMNFIWEETGSPIFHPPESLTRLIEAGYLGRKTGLGFYEYPQEDKRKET